MTMALDGNAVRSVDRAAALLLALGDSQGEAGVTELARRLGLHKSTASRLLATLQLFAALVLVVVCVNTANLLLARATALHNVELPLIYAGVSSKDREERATLALREVDLEKRMLHKPSELSGGQRQRVAVARALVMRPAVLLADEPTGDLDEQAAESLHGLLRDMHQSYDLTSIIATHNPRLAGACDRVPRLQDGRLVPA